MGNIPTWDTLRVEVGRDGRRNVRTTMEWDGGRPGYDKPWVSWLHHGRMMDWELLDEPFYVEDEDRSDDELSGLC
jgi:hypothetical protein